MEPLCEAVKVEVGEEPTGGQASSTSQQPSGVDRVSNPFEDALSHCDEMDVKEEEPIEDFDPVTGYAIFVPALKSKPSSTSNHSEDALSKCDEIGIKEEEDVCIKDEPIEDLDPVTSCTTFAPALESKPRSKRRFTSCSSTQLIMPKEDAHFNGKLVEAVEKHPCLYNYHLKDYSNREKVNTAWANVAQEMESSVKECKETWRNLRTVFIRALKKPPSGSGKPKKKYYLVDTMQFLLPYISTKNDGSLPGNLPSPPTTSTEQCETNEIQDDIATVNVMDTVVDQTDSRTIDEGNEASGSAISQQANYAQSKPSSANSSMERPKKRNKAADVDECVINYIRSKTESRESNPRRLFLLSLLPDVEEMDSNQFRSFRQQVINLIDNTLASSRPYSRAEQAQTPYSWSSSGSYVPQQGVPNQENVLSPTEYPNEQPDFPELLERL